MTGNEYKLLHSLDTIELYFFAQQCPDKTSGPGITCHRWHIKWLLIPIPAKRLSAHTYIILCTVTKLRHRIWRHLKAIILTVFADIILNKGMAHYISYRVIDQALISDKCLWSIGSYIHIPFTTCCVVYRTAKHTPDILNIALHHKRSRELSVRDDLLPILFLVLS